MTEKVLPYTKGTLHEVLVGYHLSLGKHMPRLTDNQTAEEVHDILKNVVTENYYDMVYERAKFAAEDIKTNIVKGDIENVFWTNKEGDLKLATGIEASQKQDASDVVVLSNSKYYGISLKVSDSKYRNFSISNCGIESAFEAQQILEDHRKKILDKYPFYADMGPTERKTYTRSCTVTYTDIKKQLKETMTQLVDNMHGKILNMNSLDLSKHIRYNVLYAHKTPMQELGHDHKKHTTLGMNNFKTKIDSPSDDYNHILDKHSDLGVTFGGYNVIFTSGGMPFAKQRFKMTTMADPLSGLKVIGQTMGKSLI